MKNYICKFLLFLLKKLGMEKELSIDYYHNVNGTWTFLQNMRYKNILTPPRIGEEVELYIDEQYVVYNVVNVKYKSDKVVLHIQ